MLVFFFFNDTATTEIYTLPLHDALPICAEDSPADTVADRAVREVVWRWVTPRWRRHLERVVEAERPEIGRHTSELQSRQYLVCRLLLEKKKTQPLGTNEVRKLDA